MLFIDTFLHTKRFTPGISRELFCEVTGVREGGRGNGSFPVAESSEALRALRNRGVLRKFVRLIPRQLAARIERTNFIKYLLCLVLALLILVPRLALLFNATDVERIPDTYSHEALGFGQALAEGKALEFILSEHKYPLLGPYLLVPIVGAYYAVGRVAGSFESSADFADAYMLGETALSFLFRLVSLVGNLLALTLIYVAARRFSPDLKGVGVFALIAASLSFYITIFSVSPRIHNLVFLCVAGTLFLSLAYFQKRTPALGVLAFGVAGLAFAASQSGLPAVLMPLTALVLAHTEGAGVSIKMFRDLRLLRKGAVGVLIFAAVSVGIGYPGAVAALLSGDIAAIPSLFVSSEHSKTGIQLMGIVSLVKDWLLALEFVWLWPLCAAVILYLSRKRERLFEEVDIIALAAVAGFLLIFGTSSVSVGRFSLAILPCLLFVAARLTSKLAGEKWFLLPLIFFIVLQTSVTFALTRAALGGDTREDAAVYLEKVSTPDAVILLNFSHHMLGLMPTPDSARALVRHRGNRDTYIIEHGTMAPRSRNISFSDLKDPLTVDLEKVTFVALRAPLHDIPQFLEQNGFVLGETFLPYREGSVVEDLNWDLPGKRSILSLFAMNRLGPPIYTFTKEQ